MSRSGAMRCKALFWIGIGLSILGVTLVVSAIHSALAHATGGLLVLSGVILALRNCRR